MSASRDTAARQAPVCVGQCVHPCETCMENERAKSYDLGKVFVMENLPKAFLKRAGEAYAAKRDDEAAWYRKMADEYQEAADETRKAYDQKWPGRRKS